MNTYEIAELAAELSRRGLAGQCRIQFTKRHRTGLAYITDNDFHLATIAQHGADGYIAINSHGQSKRGNTRAQAFASLLDDTT